MTEIKMMMLTPEGLIKIPLPRRMLSNRFKIKMILEALGDDKLYSPEIEKKLNALGYKFSAKSIGTFIFWHMFNKTVGFELIPYRRWERRRYFKINSHVQHNYKGGIIDPIPRA